MEEKLSDSNTENKDDTENKAQSPQTHSRSSSNSEYELIDNNEGTEKEDKQKTPVLENVMNDDLETAVSDAMHTAQINSSAENKNNVKIGKSIFYDCLDKSEKSEEKLTPDTDEDVATYEIDPEYQNDGNFTIFSNVVYLGSAKMSSNPKSESEILHHINELNRETNGIEAVKVKISIPNCADGQVM